MNKNFNEWFSILQNYLFSKGYCKKLCRQTLETQFLNGCSVEESAEYLIKNT